MLELAKAFLLLASIGGYVSALTFVLCKVSDRTNTLGSDDDA